MSRPKWTIKLNRKHPEAAPSRSECIWVGYGRSGSLDYVTKAKRRLYSLKRDAIEECDPDNGEEVLKVE